MSRSELVVAFATENDVSDREIYRMLLRRVLEREVAPYNTDIRFDGVQSVRSQAELFLRNARRDGVRYALFAIDNDSNDHQNVGRRPEHDDAHVREQQMQYPSDACRTCWLGHFIPPWWQAEGGQLCLAVPTQAIETWLLWLRGYSFRQTPERSFDVNSMKRWFYGTRKPPVELQIQQAAVEIDRPDALDRLRERPSFVRFERQARSWLSVGETTTPPM